MLLLFSCGCLGKLIAHPTLQCYLPPCHSCIVIPFPCQFTMISSTKLQCIFSQPLLTTLAHSLPSNLLKTNTQASLFYFVSSPPVLSCQLGNHQLIELMASSKCADVPVGMICMRIGLQMSLSETMQRFHLKVLLLFLRQYVSNIYLNHYTFTSLAFLICNHSFNEFFK